MNQKLVPFRGYGRSGAARLVRVYEDQQTGPKKGAKSMKRQMVAIGCVAVLLGAAASAVGQTRDWKGSGATNDFDLTANWIGGLVPQSGESWRMHYDILDNTDHQTADYRRTGTIADIFPTVTIESGFALPPKGQARNLTFQKTGTRPITINTTFLLQGTGSEKSTLDIDVAGLSVTGTTILKRLVDLKVASGVIAGLGTVSVDASLGPTQFFNLETGTIVTGTMTLNAVVNNDATLRHSNGSLTLTSLVLDGASGTGIALVDVDSNLTVITTVQDGKGRFDILGGVIFTGNATSVTAVGFVENAATVLEIGAPGAPGGAGEFKATTLDITGSGTTGKADVKVNSGMLRTSGLVKLSNPGPSSSVSLLAEITPSGPLTVTDLNSLELGADTKLTAKEDVLVRGDLKVKADTTPVQSQVGNPGYMSILEAGSLTIEGARIWQPTFQTSDSFFVTR